MSTELNPLVYVAINRLGRGHENARPPKELASVLSINERTLRALLEEARADGFLVCNDMDGKGYYLADSIEDVERQYSRDYGRAMDFYQMAYLDPDAQYRLGNMYRRGHTRNGEPWYFEAYEQYEKAAEQGHAEAQYFLGMLYRSGLGVRKDYEWAQLWLERALDNGSWHARKFFKGCRNITDKIMEV